MNLRRDDGRRERLAARALARVIDTAVWFGSRLPVGAAHRLADVGGTLEWALRPGKRRLLAGNLAHALGASPTDRAVRRTVRAEIRNEAHRSADLLWALGRPEEFLATVEVIGAEHAQRALEAERGLVVAGTHLGGWEVATAVPGALLGVPVSVIVADDWLAWAIEHARVAAGLEVLYPDTAALRAVRALEAGEAVVMLGDNARHARHTHRVRFLDGEVDMAAGVVALARLSGAPIVTFTVLPLARRRWRVTVDPAIGPPDRGPGAAGERAVLQLLAARWSESIRAHPEHWAVPFRLSWVGADQPDD